MKKIEADVLKVLYRNTKNYYSIVSARVDGDTDILVGYFPIINNGLKLLCYGKKEAGRNNREQYKIDSYTLELPKNEFHLFQFLINDFINMEPNLASVVSDKVGLTYLSEHHNFKLISEKIGDQKYFNQHYIDLKEASSRLDEIKRKLSLMATMNEMQFPSDISAKVAFSDLFITVESIKGNPYQIIFPFDLDWDKVDRIAAQNGIEPDSTVRIHEGICYLLDVAAKKHGHIYLHREDTLIRLRNLLRLNLSKEQFRIYEVDLVELKRIYCDVEDHLYGYRYFIAEKELAKNLYRILQQEKEDTEKVELTLKHISNDSFDYSPEQYEAITTALEEPLSVIIGPAGSGKTTTLRRIIELIQVLNKSNEHYEIQLCAPTGRAAERMKALTGLPAKTLHSVLNHHALHKTPEFNSKNPLDADCIIVDESSMVDTILFSEIITAAKKGCKIVIVGDSDQLPSIGPGNVLYEILKNKDFPVVQLETVFRQGEESPILELATRVRKGNSDIADIINKKSDELTFIQQNNAKLIADMVIKTASILLNKPNFDFYTDFQIITPIHKGDLGTIILNQRIQKLMNEKGRTKKVTFGDKDFYVGDKVIHTVNNKSKKVSNGEIGRVVDIIRKTIVVEFEGDKSVTYEGEDLFELELAFATTVHKMQGSETGVLLFIVHTLFRHMLERKMLYTGLTRAKKRLMLFGQLHAVISAIEKDTALERNCNLAQRFLEVQWEL